MVSPRNINTTCTAKLADGTVFGMAADILAIEIIVLDQSALLWQWLKRQVFQTARIRTLTSTHKDYFIF